MDKCFFFHISLIRQDKHTVVMHRGATSVGYYRQHVFGTNWWFGTLVTDASKQTRLNHSGELRLSANFTFVGYAL